MGLFSTKKQAPSSSRSKPQGQVKLRNRNDQHEVRDQRRPSAGLLTSHVPIGSPVVGSAAPPPCHGHDQRHYAPVIMNNNYYLAPPPLPQWLYPNHSNVYEANGEGYVSGRARFGSAVDLLQKPVNVVNQFVDDGLPRWHANGTQLINQGAAVFDQISSRFNDVMTLIDRDKFTGDESDLLTYQFDINTSASSGSTDKSHRPTAVSKSSQETKKKKSKDAPKSQTDAVASSRFTGSYIAKVYLYANSKLPADLPSFRVPLPTLPLLCLAAQYAQRVYDKPRGAERDAHVDADWRTGAKAMFIKSVPMDDVGAIVFAIRGTATFMDWAVNLNTAPTSPTGFLDDASNFCHAGFLSVARKMVRPVAARLRQLLEEDPGRCAHSLLITGHSAGGAVASLLYTHMLATSGDAASELNLLTGCFKNIHCVTFGAPPVSLFPLQTPRRRELRKSMFYSFVNEGDPVTRANKAYVKSLLELFTAPAPALAPVPTTVPPKTKPPSDPCKKKSSQTSLASKTSRLATKASQSFLHSATIVTGRDDARRVEVPSGPVWRVPPSILSNAGQIVVLRSGSGSGSSQAGKGKRIMTIAERLEERGVVAQVASDEMLRGVIWGDPVCHVMKLYAARVDALAVSAITARGY